jgi:multidrug resistance efflux pump
VKLSTKTQVQEYQLTETSEAPLRYRLPSRSLLSNLLLLLLSGGLLLWSLQFLKTRMTSVLSVDAVVNAAITDIKAPDVGTVAEVTRRTGETVTAGQPLFTLKNDRVNQLPIQELQGKVNQQRALLTQAQDRLTTLTALMGTLVQDEDNQSRLEISEAKREIAQITSQLEGAKARLSLAEVNYQRVQTLNTQGAIAQANVDAADIEVKQKQSDMATLEAQIDSLRVNQEAAEQGLSLSKTRSNYDPRIRRQELQLQIQEQQRTIQTIEQAVRDAEDAVAQGQKDLQVKQQTVIKAPTAGMLWQMSVEPGRVVQPGEFMAKVVDCEQRWVDAVVEESAVRSISIGDSANVELYADQAAISLTGKVTQIRSGLGRLTPGQDITGSVDLNLPRHTQVRVALDASAKDQTKQDLAQKNFCYIGYTGKVALQVKPTPGPANPLAALASWLRL